LIKIGQYNRLIINRQVPFGVYLKDTEGGEEVLLPKKYLPQKASTGDELDVFIYLDSEDRLIATTLKPKARVGDFTWLKVVGNSQFGAFMDWGLEKDLFVPFREQRNKTIPGNYYLVYIYLDEESGRIAGSTKYYKFLEKNVSGFEEGQEVDVLIHERTDLGFLAIIENKYNGLIYQNEIYRGNISSGSKTKAFIRRIREDGKVDLSLQKQGFESVKDFAAILLQDLKKSNGFIGLTDKSDPKLIYERFGVSKKVFKKGVGNLYKLRKIRIEKAGITLIDP
jgi:predicted RNA-binding protein (virulence factor B family)